MERVKWSLWHGQSGKALVKLELLITNITDPKKRKKLKGLYNYLKSNQAYLVNYGKLDNEHKTYTSQAAESHIESIINARHKKSGKMQWTREGAHNVLQIRGAIASNECSEQWQATVLSALGAAA